MSLPISIEEYGRVLHSTHESSPSLEGVERTVLCGIEPRIGVAHMNLWLLACCPPEAFKVGVTVSLPKTVDAVGPDEPSGYYSKAVLVGVEPATSESQGRDLTTAPPRVVGHRAERSLPLGPRQKAFREGDGLADNVWIL